MNRFHSTTAAITLLCLAGAASAHQVWIEQAPSQNAVLRFGEFGENLREASPGLLDKFAQPTATLLSAKGEQKADASKTGSGFVLPFKAGKGDAIVAEEAAYPINTWKQGDKEITGWYYPAARLVTGPAALEPRLPLDIVPTGKAGEFRVVFKGQPQAKAKVALVTRSGWAREAHSDEQGLVRFPMPWKGSYVAEASFIDRTPGERAGTRYDQVSYVTSLTYVKPDGATELPASPAATPNK